MKPQRRGVSRDLRLIAVALGLVALCGAFWLWQSGDARERRDAVLAKVPDFPAPGQPMTHPRRAEPIAPRPPPRLAPPPPQPAPDAPKRKVDAITSFVLQPSHSVALIHVNALLNTPLFEKIKACMPDKFADADKETSNIGFDLQRDVDRVAFVDGGGVAMYGFFEGKPIAETMAKRWQYPAETRDYRGATMFLGQRIGLAQIGNLIVEGPPDQLPRLIDRALDPPPPAADPEQVYGDVFWKSDLTTLRSPDAAAGGPRDAMDAMLQAMSGLTMRANVWDSVALSVEGAPRDGQTARDLARMARGAISLAKEQLDHDDVELSALAELANVQSDKDQLRVDLAVPATDLFDRLRIPCPGRDGTPSPAQPRRFPGPNVPK